MELPAVDRLGYALDVSRITAMDIGAVDNYLLNLRRLIYIDLDDTRDVVIDGVTYSVPRAVSIANDNQIVQGEYINFANGKEAADAFSADASYALRYFAVSGTTSATFASQKSFLRDRQYAFFSYTEGKYSARLRDYADSLNETPLVRGLENVPLPFDSSKTDVVNKYKTFFQDYGSHIVVNANYGARYPLKVWASNEDPAVNNMFNTDVKAKFNGIPSGGEFNAAVKNEDQYMRFSEYFQYLLTISGGGDSSKLANTDGTYQDYMNWVNSIPSRSPSLLSFQVIELWTLMKLSPNTTLRSYADPLYDAFMWLVGHPQVYRTHVSLDIQTDWAAFNLLTPSAVIIPDPSNPYPPTLTEASDTRVQWGKEYSHNYQRQTLRFYVINDGSPIDFSISKGSMAGSDWSQRGVATVTFEGNNYINDAITDNVWNTRWYYKAPVSSVPETRQARRTDKPFYTWDEILHNYLGDLRAEGFLA